VTSADVPTKDFLNRENKHSLEGHAVYNNTAINVR